MSVTIVSKMRDSIEFITYDNKRKYFLAKQNEARIHAKVIETLLAKEKSANNSREETTKI